MTVEEGHVLNIDASSPTGGGGNQPASSSSKYMPNRSLLADVEDGFGPDVTGTGAGGAGAGGGGGGGEDAGAGETDMNDDKVSVMSGGSRGSKTTSQLEAQAKLPWYRGVTCKDVRDIMPTLLILLGGLLIMIFVIPYAFSSVMRQLEDEERRNAAKLAKKLKKQAEKLSTTLATLAADDGDATTGMPAVQLVTDAQEDS